jgi:preprotein translocase subunit SecG
MLYLKPLIEVVLILSALGLIGLVLLQHGKGADMGAAFGSGASGSLFGASGSANFLSHMTALLATVFFAATLALTWMSSHQARSSAAGVLSEAPVTAPAPKLAIPAPAVASSAASAPVVFAASSVQPSPAPSRVPK